MKCKDYHETNVISYEVGSKNRKCVTIACASSGICSVIPCYSSFEVTLTFDYQVCLVRAYLYLFPAITEIGYGKN